MKMYSKQKLMIALSVFGLAIMGCGSSSNETHNTEKEQHVGDLHEHVSDNKSTASETTEKKKPKSPKTASMANIGDNHIHIEYGSPSVRGRVIWGGLVPYGEVWASGAHNATSITFSQDVVIGEVEIPKGKYAFFTIPGEETWTVIINKDWDQHLADNYDEKKDMVRLTIVPEENDFVEALRYSVVPDGDNNGYIHFEWENLILAIEVTNL